MAAEEAILKIQSNSGRFHDFLNPHMFPFLPRGGSMHHILVKWHLNPSCYLNHECAWGKQCLYLFIPDSLKLKKLEGFKQKNSERI